MSCSFRPRRNAVALCTLAAGTLALLAAVPLPAGAKTPGHRYCFRGVCHTVATLEETRRMVGRTMWLRASFYDDAGRDAYNPSNITSSGEYFRSSRPDNAASPLLPDGTKVLVWHAGTGRAVVLRINNAGPYHGDRKLDLSRGAAERLGISASGVASVQLRVLEAPTRAEATYRLGRNYPPVKGFIGAFASMDLAFAGAGGGDAPQLPLPSKVAGVRGPFAMAAARRAERSVAEPVAVAVAQLSSDGGGGRARTGIAMADTADAKTSTGGAGLLPVGIAAAGERSTGLAGAMAFAAARVQPAVQAARAQPSTQVIRIGTVIPASMVEDERTAIRTVMAMLASR